ncbi:uncharacterized protein LOC133286515 [Gastrolobium bilobum]|uniref:uncharacterized protein LOC133286515 n=1 Tax=Gastrolobium bilobum TaxID=150636 RepID=UPI002AAF88E3|nr:uncharacterized protein LOC133286515 [Gastrolobium bilobum]
MEEEDLQSNSVQKPKGVGPEDQHMDEDMQEKTDDVVENVAMQVVSNEGSQGLAKEPSSARKIVSYKDKLLHLNGDGYVSDSEDEHWMVTQKREEEEEDVEEVTGEEGVYEVIDLDNGHLLLRFSDEKDYFRILHEGPWVLADHYLIVQRWRPMFNPYDEDVRKLAIWMRIPSLPIELYSSHHLWRIGNIFGRTLKVDKNSIRRVEERDEEVTSKARYTRICVEVNLNKSLLSKFKIGDQTFQVGYEGLHLICFSCGQYRHKKEHCGTVHHSKSVQANQVSQSQGEGATNEVGSARVDECLW